MSPDDFGAITALLAGLGAFIAVVRGSFNRYGARDKARLLARAESAETERDGYAEREPLWRRYVAELRFVIADNRLTEPPPPLQLTVPPPLPRITPQAAESAAYGNT